MYCSCTSYTYLDVDTVSVGDVSDVGEVSILKSSDSRVMLGSWMLFIMSSKSCLVLFSSILCGTALLNPLLQEEGIMTAIRQLPLQLWNHLMSPTSDIIEIRIASLIKSVSLRSRFL